MAVLSIRAYRKYHIRFGILSSRTIPLLCRHRIRQKYRMQNTRPRTFLCGPQNHYCCLYKYRTEENRPQYRRSVCHSRTVPSGCGRSHAV